MKNMINPFSRSNFLVQMFGHYLFEPINQISIKVPKVFEPTNKMPGLQNFGYQCNLQSNVPSFPPKHFILEMNKWMSLS